MTRSNVTMTDTIQRDSHFGAESQAQISSLQSKVGELEEQLKQKDQEIASKSQVRYDTLRSPKLC